jgi:hypothetical protein
MRALLMLTLAALSLAAAPAQDQPPPKPAPKPAPAIRHAVVADCVLWTVNAHAKIAGKRVCGPGVGEAVAIDERRLGHGVHGLSVENGRLWYAAAWYAHVSTPTRIRSLDGKELPEFELRIPERLLAFSVHSGHAVALTSHHVMTFQPGDEDWTSRPLAKALVERGVYYVASPLSDSHDLYVGRDAGEFGHDLHRVDARTGAVAAVATSLDRCGWNRSYRCAPGGQVIADPFTRGCVIASATTDLLRLCVGRPPQLIPLPRPKSKDGVITNGDGIQGLAAGDGAVFASTLQGFYRIEGPKAVPTTELKGVTPLARDPAAPGWPPMLVPVRR